MKRALIIAIVLGSGAAAMSCGTAATHLAEAAYCAVNTACLPWQAPVGHRQPEAADTPSNFPPLPPDLESEVLDKALDRRLTICRGC